MFNFFSNSNSKKRYPDPNRNGAYYQRKGFLGGFGSFSNSSSGRRYYSNTSHNGYNQVPYQVQTPSNSSDARPTGANPGVIGSSAASGEILCSKCHARVPAGSKFCLSCGAPIASAAFCSGCGRPLPAGAKFCPECGTPRS